MSPQIINEHALAEVIGRTGWASIDEIYEASLDANVFGSDFYKNVIERAGKDALRRRLRRGIRDVGGNLIRVANIVTKNPVTGSPARVYKQENLFDMEDFVQVVRYWKTCKKKCDQRIKYYVKLATEQHGPEAKQLLLFGNTEASSA